MVVADIVAFQGPVQRLDAVWIAVAEAEGAAVQVEVDQPVAVVIPHQITLALADHERDAVAGPLLHLARADIFGGLLQQGELTLAHMIGAGDLD